MAKYNGHEDEYLSFQFNHLIQAPSHRLSFLGFFITINIAIYAAIYSIDHNLWQYSNLRILLLVSLIIINLSIFIIYSRENQLSVWIEKSLRDYEIPSVASYIKRNDRANRGLTWISIKMMLALFVAIPISYFLILIKKDKNYLKLASGFSENSAFVIVTSIVFFIFFSPLAYYLIRTINAAANKNAKE